MRRRLPYALCGVVLAHSSSPAAPAPSIDHQPVRCVVAERFPRLEAQFVPTDAIARARVLFQPEHGKHWYAVAMKPEGSAFSGVLPKPKKSLKALRYYIEVVDKALGTGRTAEYTANVVETPGECPNKMVAGGLGSASVLVEAPPGAPTVPAGFSASGVTSLGATGGAAAASAGGGASKALLIGLAGAGAAGAAVVVARSSSGGGSDAAAGTYVLEQIDGRSLPALYNALNCTDSVDSGSLRLESGSKNYELTTQWHVECLNGPGARPPVVETGRWSESGGTITFTVRGGSPYNLSTGSFAGSTLTFPMTAPGNARPRVESTWRKQ